METIRRQLITLLSETALSVKELSQAIRASEKEIGAHLPHVRKTVLSQKRRFVVNPAACMTCGYRFENRRRLTRPGRCPKCKGSYLQDPTYRITGKE